jgi:1-acyl-sn-glycerol-3-phosphate acyltransferase
LISHLLATQRALGLLLWTIGSVSVHFAFRACRHRDPLIVPKAWFRGCCRISGIDLNVTGGAASSRPVLFVSNHVSYLDIIVLGSVLDGSFVAKSEISRWPVIGALSRLHRTAFVERRASRAATQRDTLEVRLEAGDSLILFPEGTSGCGTHVLPFKSSLFSLAGSAKNGREITVQPVSIAYTRVNGIPTGRFLAPFCAWYGDMTMAPHFWRFLGLGRTAVEVVLHPAVSISEFGNRKALAKHCQDAITRATAAARSGRLETHHKDE